MPIRRKVEFMPSSVLVLEKKYFCDYCWFVDTKKRTDNGCLYFHISECLCDNGQKGYYILKDVYDN